MRIVGVIIVSILTLGVAGSGGYLAYQQGIAQGEDSGYATGYIAGEELGYDAGSNDGYSEGYDVGSEVGYETGVGEGYENGYDTGFSEGEETGYGTGFSEGRTTGYASGYEIGYGEGSEESLGHGYTLKDPTYAEALAFIRSDRTNENQYILNPDGTGYVCVHYARDIGNNAEAAGYRSAYIDIRYIENGHAIIAFNTTDRGMVYFEPQSDELVEPVIGTRYYQCILPNPGTYYPEPNYDDTIRDMVIIW